MEIVGDAVGERAAEDGGRRGVDKAGVVVGGAAVSELLPLVGLGVVSGGVGGLISGSASAAAKRAGLPGSKPPRLPAT